MLARQIADHVSACSPLGICDACLANILGRPVALIASVTELLSLGGEMARETGRCASCDRTDLVTRAAGP